MSELQLEIKKDPYEQAKKYLKGKLEKFVDSIIQVIDKMYLVTSWDMVESKIDKFVQFFSIVVRESEFLENGLAEEKIELLTEAVSQKDKNKVKQVLYNIKNLLDEGIERYPVEIEESIAIAVIETSPNHYKINRILYYNIAGETLKLHISPISTIKGLQVIKRLLKDGLQKIAKIVEKDERIKIIQGTSPLVKEGRKLVKFFGFEIKDSQKGIRSSSFLFSKDDTQSKTAYMTREKFLEKFLED